MVRAVATLAVASLILTLALLAPGPVRSEEDEPAAIPVSSRGPLDGLSFEGMFGPPDGSSDRADVLYFSDGHFWSENCVPCGFLPGPYRARQTEEGIRFEGLLKSPDRGRFRYTGLVKDGRVMAQINWRKERWYWTIDKDFRFEGVRAESSAAVSVKSMMRVAITANPEPDKCRP